MIAEEPRLGGIEAGKILHIGQRGRGLGHRFFRYKSLG